MTAIRSIPTATHLWGHFTPFSDDGFGPVIERGEGCYVWDEDGHRYLDGLAGLFVTQVGHGRQSIVEAAAEQMGRLAYFPLWEYAHPASVRLATRLAALAPDDLNRVFFTTGGSEAVESAWKLAIQYFNLKGEPHRRKVISRDLAYHGASMGALSVTALPRIRTIFEPLVPGAVKVGNTDPRSRKCGHADLCLCAAEEIEQAILREGPETVAAVILEPVQNAGGCIVPPEGYFQRVREICDEYGVLLVSDEVICAFGRIGHMFGAERFGYTPDIITVAKGLTSGYVPLGAMLVSDRIAAPFRDGETTFAHGFTFAGHPVACAAALANLDILEGEDLPGGVLAQEAAFERSLQQLIKLPIVGDIRGAGFFWALELVDGDPRRPFSLAEADQLCRQLSTHTRELGLICRATNRGRPVLQLSPPLIAGPQEFEIITTILQRALTQAMNTRGICG